MTYLITEGDEIRYCHSPSCFKAIPHAQIVAKDGIAWLGNKLFCSEHCLKYWSRYEGGDFLSETFFPVSCCAECGEFFEEGTGITASNNKNVCSSTCSSEYERLLTNLRNTLEC